MKRTPLVFAALVPLAALAGGQTQNSSITIDEQNLENTVPVTEITGKDVLSRDGRDVGDVEDVILDQDGSISSLIVSREGETDDGLQGVSDVTAQTAGAESGGGETAGTAETDLGDAGGMEFAANDESAALSQRTASGDHASLNWSDVTYDAREAAIRLNGSESSMQSVQYEEDAATSGESGIRASTIVGMDVNLADEQSYGEVEDVLIDTQQGKAKAIVVDGGGLFSNETYALPANFDAVDEQEEQVDLKYSQQQIDSAEEFDLDSVTDIT